MGVLTAGALALVASACAGTADAPTEGTPVIEESPAGDDAAQFILDSDAFPPDGPIPAEFTCDGENVSPALSWNGAPAATQSFALILDDPDAPVGVFTHWLAYNLPGFTEALPLGAGNAEVPPGGGAHGVNSFGTIGYGGPCPPQGESHRYQFTLYALGAELDLEAGASKDDLLTAMEGHVLGQAGLTGTYAR